MNLYQALTLSDPWYFGQLTFRGGGGLYVHFTRCFRNLLTGIFQKFAILTILQQLQSETSWKTNNFAILFKINLNTSKDAEF